MFPHAPGAACLRSESAAITFSCFPPEEVNVFPPVFGGQVEVRVDIQQDVFEEAQPLPFCLLREVEHLLHVLHVARVAPVQILQGLSVALLCLQNKHTYKDSLPQAENV